MTAVASDAELGVLLVNLGTPAAPTEEAVREYLAAFLSDPRVVALPRIVWLPLLHGLILRTRPRKSAEKYRAIWTPEGSPLAVHTERQAALLQAALPGCRVRYAMRYGKPSILEALAKLRSTARQIVLPLYPQYAGSTTEAVRDCLPRDARMLENFHDHPAYIGALAAQIEAYWAAHGQPDILLMSFHGLPQRAIDRGDPYRSQCERTAQLLAQKLGLKGERGEPSSKPRYRVAYQSRFGRAAWLRPYTSDMLRELGTGGCRRVDVACPGFVSDCLETLEEIGIEGRRTFIEAGGGELHLLPCLNESPAWIDALARIVLEHAARARPGLRSAGVQADLGAA